MLSPFLLFYRNLLQLCVTYCWGRQTGPLWPFLSESGQKILEIPPTHSFVTMNRIKPNIYYMTNLGTDEGEEENKKQATRILDDYCYGWYKFT